MCAGVRRLQPPQCCGRKEEEETEQEEEEEEEGRAAWKGQPQPGLFVGLQPFRARSADPPGVRASRTSPGFSGPGRKCRWFLALCHRAAAAPCSVASPLLSRPPSLRSRGDGSTFDVPAGISITP